MLSIEIDHCHLVAVDLYSNDFVSKWSLLFEQTVTTCDINQNESFTCCLTEERSQQRLLLAIDTINRFFKNDFIEVPANIDWNDQCWYNILHTKFEQLAGTYDSPSRLFTIAPDTVKDAIRSLNFYVHRLETRPYRANEVWYISFDKDCYKRIPLDTEDYKYFQSVIEPGQAFVQYADLGKTTIDLYKDGLPKDYPGLKNLHYYSAELSLHLGPEFIELFTDDFREWANTNSIDLDDPTLGLGVIPVGKVRDLDTARQIVYNGNNITKLRMI
jgi:hypothetical protein